MPAYLSRYLGDKRSERVHVILLPNIFTKSNRCKRALGTPKRFASLVIFYTTEVFRDISRNMMTFSRSFTHKHLTIKFIAYLFGLFKLLL